MAHEPLLKMPTEVASPSDLNHLVREIDSLNEALLELKLRHSGTSTKLPKTSLLLDEIVKQNKLNLLHETDRSKLTHFLKYFKDNAPVLHMSFSADPSPLFLSKLTGWLRQNIHPLTLIT